MGIAAGARTSAVVLWEAGLRSRQSASGWGCGAVKAVRRSRRAAHALRTSDDVGNGGCAGTPRPPR